MVVPVVIGVLGMFLKRPGEKELWNWKQELSERLSEKLSDNNCNNNEVIETKLLTT